MNPAILERVKDLKAARNGEQLTAEEKMLIKAKEMTNQRGIKILNLILIGDGAATQKENLVTAKSLVSKRLFIDHDTGWELAKL